MNILKHLFPEPEHTQSLSLNDSDQLFKYDVSIHEVEVNPYYLPFGDNPTHWELRIQPMGAWVEEGEEPEWGEMGNTYEFKMSRYTLPPTIEEFSKHIYDECWATINAMGWDAEKDFKYLSDETKLCQEWIDIEPQHVYAFLKEIHKDYTKTEDFLKDFVHYRDRMYNNLKFMYGMIAGYKGMFLKSFEVPIGRHFFDFLGIDIYKDNLKEVTYPDYYFPTHWDATAHKKCIVLDYGKSYQPELTLQDEEGNIYKQFDSFVKAL